MRVTGLNHVSISSVDVETSVRFYVEVLGLEPIDTYTFAFPTRYLRLGDVQLHVFQRENTDAPPFHHIGLNIDDFEGAYKRAKELDMLDREAFYSPIWELPDGTVQLYLRDPGGNLPTLHVADATEGASRTSIAVSIEGQLMIAWVDAGSDNHNAIKVVRHRLDCSSH